MKSWSNHRSQVVFLTAGPLGTVLAGELACLGIRAIDAGHIYKKIAEHIELENSSISSVSDCPAGTFATPP